MNINAKRRKIWENMKISKRKVIESAKRSENIF